MNTVTSAGSTPARNSIRHPYAGRIQADNPAAAMYPSAQPDCMKLTAFARCSAGHDSATSVAPADHSPPRPNPTSARQKTRSTIPREVAVPADASEYKRIV
ncbi:MAG: hypothetical protein QM757_43725 [Paludibaculum sp.]